MPFDAHQPAHAGRRLTAEYVAARALAESVTLTEAAVGVLQAICEAHTEPESELQCEREKRAGPPDGAGNAFGRWVL